MKEMTPFSPGRLVDIEYFVGRQREIERVRRALRAAASGRNENLFITGERGIGKSSLAALTCYLARQQHNFLAAHCLVGGAGNLPEVLRLALDALVRQVSEEGLVKKVTAALERYVEKVDASLFGVGLAIHLARDPQKIRDLPLEFLPALRRVFEQVKDQKRGIALVLDDLNGVTRTTGLANFLKSFVDQMAAEPPMRFPLLLALVGVEDRMTDLSREQPSLPRIFDVVQLEPMSEDECRQFYSKAFEAVRMSVEEGALKTMVRHSGGIPVFLHEIGDATYWQDQDNHITTDDVLNGLVAAVDNIGEKYLDRHVHRAIRSKTYHSILGRIARHPERILKRAEIQKGMSEEERKRLDNFLHRMRRLSFLVPGSEPGTYEFPNELYRVYFMLHAVRGRAKPAAKGTP